MLIGLLVVAPQLHHTFIMPEAQAQSVEYRIDQSFIGTVSNSENFARRHLDFFILEMGLYSPNDIDNLFATLHESPLQWIEVVLDKLQFVDNADRKKDILNDVERASLLYANILLGKYNQLSTDDSDDNKFAALFYMQKLVILGGINSDSLQILPIELDYYLNRYRASINIIVEKILSIPGSEDINSPQGRYLHSLNTNIKKIEEIIENTVEAELNLQARVDTHKWLINLLFEALNTEELVKILSPDIIRYFLCLNVQNIVEVLPKMKKIHEKLSCNRSEEEKIEGVLNLIKELE